MAYKKYGHVKRGKREDLGNIYFRSGWEANWARYLDFLKKHGEIAKWEYEPDTFEFHAIKRGTRFYTPDFKITNNDGSVVYHEVKGHMSQQGKTKLKRMAKYYPEVEIIIIGPQDYRRIEKQIGPVIKNWE